jgi:hypothetical protein
MAVVVAQEMFLSVISAAAAAGDGALETGVV